MKLKVSKTETKIADYRYDEVNVFYRPGIVAVDTECTGLLWATKDYPFAVSMAWYDEQGNIDTAYFEWGVNPTNRLPSYNQENFNYFSSYYCDPNINIVFANAKYDMHMIYKAFGLLPRGNIYDVLVAAWCCKTNEDSYRLNDLAEKYAEINQEDERRLKEVVNKARKNIPPEWKAGPGISRAVEDYWLPRLVFGTNECEVYARKDVIRTLELWEFYEQGMKELEVRDAFNLEMDLLSVIFKMEQRGVRFFEDECKKERENLANSCLVLEKEIRDYFGYPKLNLNSPKQLAECFYGVTGLSLPVEKCTPSGQPSTDVKTLEGYKERYPIVGHFLKYKGKNTGFKYLSNYLDSSTRDMESTENDLPFLHERRSIHPNFNQIASEQDRENKTRTGRLSSSNPNLQNVADPEKSVGLFVTDGRSFFGPRDGYIWYCIDYSQLELRIFAERTGGKLKEAFLAGRDPHNETREQVLYLKNQPEELGRKLAKHTNFTIINCGGARVLQEKYGIPFQEGKQIVRGFFNAFPETNRRQREAEAFAISHGYIETLFGRKINVDLTTRGDEYIYAYRATSYDIQGSAADIIKRAMIQTSEYLSSIFPQVEGYLVLSIHDELVFEINRRHAYKWVLKKLISIMESVASGVMDIPLKCEIVKTKKSWSSKDKEKVVM